MVQQLFSAGLALSSTWEKARTRDGQREVAGDKGQWDFVLQGMRPAAEATSRDRQRKVAGDKGQWGFILQEMKPAAEARSRHGQREVAGDKGQWGFVLQGMKPAVAQAVEWWQGAVLIIPPFFV
jgi:hypothetical protein